MHFLCTGLQKKLFNISNLTLLIINSLTQFSQMIYIIIDYSFYINRKVFWYNTCNVVNIVCTPLGASSTDISANMREINHMFVHGRWMVSMFEPSTLDYRLLTTEPQGGVNTKQTLIKTNHRKQNIKEQQDFNLSMQCKRSVQLLNPMKTPKD